MVTSPTKIDIEEVSYSRQYCAHTSADNGKGMVRKINTDIYQGFTVIDIRQHAYMPDGEFAGDLGDLMMLTLANILNTPITLFT